jgi:hypothetical protein
VCTQARYNIAGPVGTGRFEPGLHPEGTILFADNPLFYRSRIRPYIRRGRARRKIDRIGTSLVDPHSGPPPRDELPFSTNEWTSELG